MKSQFGIDSINNEIERLIANKQDLKEPIFWFWLLKPLKNFAKGFEMLLNFTKIAFLTRYQLLM
nr:hypothetical protein [uncultured Pedobacter sp.]